MQRLLALLAVAGVSLLAFIGERRVSSNGGGIFAAVIEGLLSSEASEEKGRRPSLLSFVYFVSMAARCRLLTLSVSFHRIAENSLSNRR